MSTNVHNRLKKIETQMSFTGNDFSRMTDEELDCRIAETTDKLIADYGGIDALVASFRKDRDEEAAESLLRYWTRREAEKVA